MLDSPLFQDYRNEWLKEIETGDPSNTELGHRFAHKLLTQWLDISEDSDDLVYCDGAGDGGIDIAYLERGENDSGDLLNGDGESPRGDTWFLVQSKYGTAFQGKSTLLIEAQKVLDTLNGERTHLSSLADGLLKRLLTFKSQASDRDKIVLVFATEKALSDGMKKTLDGIREMGRQQLGAIFDVEAISIDTIYQRLIEGGNASAVRAAISAQLTPSGGDLLVGPISLLRLYDFLKEYRAQTGDLDRLYEKNVRRFLGSRGRVNSAIKKTLEETPQLFGLYNNGITIVVKDFQHGDHGRLTLYDPYIVNGCQTTRTIWDVFYQRREAGGTGHNPKLEEWNQQVSRGVIVAKIVKVGVGGVESLKALENITRYTNTQNAVREKDFLTLTSDFKNWAEEMKTRYSVFLETQRGEWDSRRAFQKQHPAVKPQFTQHANAFDLIKVYGAGWLREAGDAFGRNAPFLPNGTIFKAIINHQDENTSFSVEDLYAAYRLQLAADNYHFGRSAQKQSRQKTRFLFYMIVLELLKHVLVSTNTNSAPKLKDMTYALLKLFDPGNEQALETLTEAAVNVVDDYLTPGMEDTVFVEPSFLERNSDLNAYLKWGELGKTETASPHLHKLLAIHKAVFGRNIGGQASPRQLVISALI